MEGGSEHDVSCEATSQGQLPSLWPLGTTQRPPAPVPAPRTGPRLCPSSGPWAERRGRGEDTLEEAGPLRPQLPPAPWFLRGLGCREEAPGPSHPPTDPPTVLSDKRPRRGPLPDTRTSDREPHARETVKRVPQRKFKKKQRKEAEEARALPPGRSAPSSEKGRCRRSRRAGPWVLAALGFPLRTGSEILQRPHHVPSSQPCYLVYQPQGHHRVDMNHSCFAEENTERPSGLSETKPGAVTALKPRFGARVWALTCLFFSPTGARPLAPGDLALWLGRRFHAMTPITIPPADTSQAPPCARLRLSVGLSHPPSPQLEEPRTISQTHFIMKTLRHSEVK